MGRSKAEIKTGDRFGRLTIIEETEPYINGSNKIRRFICKCDCGNTITKKITDIKQSHLPSCGCTARGKKSLIGKRFGRLLVTGYNPKNYKWICKCNCGGTKEVIGCELSEGKVKSCGCLRRKDYIAKVRDYPTELLESKLYPLWVEALNASFTTKKVTMCKEWRNNFIPFYLWCLHHGYTNNSHINKIDEKGIYEPSNLKIINEL
jgi:hypothetical protein